MLSSGKRMAALERRVSDLSIECSSDTERLTRLVKSMDKRQSDRLDNAIARMERKLHSSNTENQEPLPPWAVAFAHGELVIGALLHTRDGRNIGNAFIVDVLRLPFPFDEELKYKVITESKTEIVLEEKEIEEFFYPTVYVGNIEEILHRYRLHRIHL